MTKRFLVEEERRRELIILVPRALYGKGVEWRRGGVAVEECLRKMTMEELLFIFKAQGEAEKKAE